MQAVQDIAVEMKHDVDRLAAAVTPELIAALIEAVAQDQSMARLEDLVAERGIRIDPDIAITPPTLTSDESPVQIGDGRMCEKTVQLRIERSGHASVSLPSLTLCVGWR